MVFYVVFALATLTVSAVAPFRKNNGNESSSSQILRISCLGWPTLRLGADCSNGRERNQSRQARIRTVTLRERDLPMATAAATAAGRPA
jgi:hypothetical protein